MPSTGDYLVWDGTGYIPEGLKIGGKAVSGTPTDGQMLEYDGTGEEWTFTSSASASEIQGRAVSSSAPTAGDLLVWSGTEWGIISPGNGISSDGSDFSVDVDGLAGDGLIENAGTIDVNVGAGLTIANDLVEVDPATAIDALAGSANLTDVIDKVNEILTNLENAGFLDSP